MCGCLRFGALFLVLVSLGGCTSADSRLGSTLRLNEGQGDSASFSWPDYTDISARGNDVAATWMALRGERNRDIVMRVSHDGGETWAPETRPNQPDFSATVSVAPQLVRFPRSDALLLLWHARRSPGGQKVVVVRRSVDAGRSFGPFRELNGTPEAFLPVWAARGAGEVVVAWTDARHGSRDVFASRSIDAGLTWLPSEVRLDENGAADAANPTLALGAAKEAVAAWVDRPAHRRGGARRSHLVGVHSGDAAASWSKPRPIEAEYPVTSPRAPVVVESNGRYTLVWTTAVAGSAHEGLLFLAQSTDAGRSWQAAQQISAGEEAPFFRLVAAGERVYLAWHGGPRRDIGIYFQASEDGGETWRDPWSNPLRLDRSPPQQNAFRPALAADEDGTLAVAWTEAHQRVVLRYSKDAGRSWSEPLEIAREEGKGTLRHPRVTISGGRAWVLWESWPDKSRYVKTLVDAGKPIPKDVFVRRVDLR